MDRSIPCCWCLEPKKVLTRGSAGIVLAPDCDPIIDSTFVSISTGWRLVVDAGVALASRAHLVAGTNMVSCRNGNSAYRVAVCAVQTNCRKEGSCQIGIVSLVSLGYNGPFTFYDLKVSRFKETRPLPAGAVNRTAPCNRRTRRSSFYSSFRPRQRPPRVIKRLELLVVVYVPLLYIRPHPNWEGDAQ